MIFSNEGTDRKKRTNTSGGKFTVKKLWAVTITFVALTLLLGACNGNDKTKFDKSNNISVVAREDNSGTKNAFMELIGIKGKSDPVNANIKTGTEAVNAEVKGNSAAIAYESLGYITSDVKVLKVDGIDATIDNIKNNIYKLSRPLSVVYQGTALEADANKTFFTFLQSSEAQKVIIAGGYVSVNDNAPAYKDNILLSGSIAISGSTSLQPLMVELAAEFGKYQPNIKVTVLGGGSGAGYKEAEEGVSAFGMISEEFNMEKAPSCMVYTVCKDGIAVIVNKDNPLENIAMEQLKNIYDDEAGTNAITKWSDLIK